MKKDRAKTRFLIPLLKGQAVWIILGWFVFSPLLAWGRGDVEAVFLYNLSNFDGPVPYNWATITVDTEKNEIYVVDTEERDIRIFNEKGMEVFRFGDDGSLGAFVDVAVKSNGHILVLSREGLRFSITLCNFRGEPIASIEPENMPPAFSHFLPDRIVYQREQIYLLDTIALRLAVLDENGDFHRGYDLISLLEMEEKKRVDAEISGFNVDHEGNVLFTIPVFFAAYKLSPNGELRGFGKPGSAPGGFGIVGGITADKNGNLYVADRLKSVILVFDKDFNFQSQFGYRGTRPENLIAPRDLALDSKNRLYVSQLSKRGVSVFKISQH